MTALDAAKAHLHKTHQGDSRRVLWFARLRNCVPELLPRETIASQTDNDAWVAATGDRNGITVTSCGGSIKLVPWDSLLEMP